MKKLGLFIFMLCCFSGAYASGFSSFTNTNIKSFTDKGYILSDKFLSFEECNTQKDKYNLEYSSYKRSSCFETEGKFQYFICNLNDSCSLTDVSSSNVQSLGSSSMSGNNGNQSVTNKDKLDKFISKLSSTRETTTPEKFKKTLDSVVSKLEALEKKYTSNATIKSMIVYLNNGVKGLYEESDIDSFFCELTGTCSENGSSTITIAPTLSVDKSSANPGDTVIFSWSANGGSDCYASINNSNAGKLSGTSGRIPVQNIAAGSYNASISCLFNGVLKTSESVDIIVKTSSIASSSASSNTSTSSSTSTSNGNSSTTSSSTSTSIGSSGGMKIIESYLNNSNYIVTGPQNVSMYSASSYSLINGDCSKAQELAAAACKDTNKGHIWTKDGAKFSARWMDASVTLSDNVNGTAYNLVSSYLGDYECSNNQIKYRCEGSGYIVKNKSSLTFSIDKYSAKIGDTVTLSYDIPENYNSCTSSISYGTDNSSITWGTSNTNKLYDELMSIGSRTGKKSLTVNKQNVRSDGSIYLYFNCYDSVNKQNVNKEVKIKVEGTSTSTSTSTAASTTNSTTTAPKTCAAGSQPVPSPNNSQTCSFSWPSRTAGQSYNGGGTNGGTISGTCSANGEWINVVVNCPNAVVQQPVQQPTTAPKTCAAGSQPVPSPNNSQTCSFSWPSRTAGQSYNGGGTNRGTISGTCSANGEWINVVVNCPNK